MRSQWKCFYALTQRELKLFFQQFFSRLIDEIVVLASWVLVFGYLMAESGLTKDFGTFIMAGAIASFGLWETTSRATFFAQDISDETINNFLILPLSSTWVFVSTAIAWAIGTSTLILMLLPIGKILLWNSFSIAHVSWWKFFFIFISGNLFYGVFALFISSLISTLRNTSWLWTRVINPLYMFCGFFYTWQSAYNVSHWIGYFNLLNPILYIVEGTKGTMFGPEGYLPFWICLTAIWLWIGIFGTLAIYRLKKRTHCL
ncbi:MAG: ABC transporter permease [Parachlamydiales bacterium]|nr:ABC transporter permease [Parachlamydiales bacterium]